MEENEKRCICLYSPSSNRMVCCSVCDIWYHMACKELDHTFSGNTNVYVCHLCIKNTLTDIFQNLQYIIKCFLNNNSGNSVVALLNNLANTIYRSLHCQPFSSEKLKKPIFENPAIQLTLNMNN